MTTANKFIIGVTVGAILGVLYAPDRGSVTRRRLHRTGNKLRETITDLRDAITDKIDSLKDDVDEMAYQEIEILENEASSMRQNAG